MTTTVSITTHGWPARVTITDDTSGEQTSGGIEQTWRSQTMYTQEVPPNTSRDFYITGTRSLRFEELPAEAPAPEPPADDPAP
jgi:hypothetical protein